MRLSHLYVPSSNRILLAALAILFSLFAGPAYAAVEPGTVTIVLAIEPFLLDTNYGTRSEIGQVLMNNITETLTEINPVDSSITPRLATSWKQIDPKTWHFFLRKGVKFHDGKDFNADSVAFSIKRQYDSKILSGIRTKFLSQIKMEGRALDSHTLEIKLDKPEPLLLTLMAVVPICSPNTPSDQLTRTPVGTGPYKFVRWDAGTQIILERFDGYWGKQPQVKKAVYVWRTESSLRASMIAVGEADLAPMIAAQDATRPDMDSSYLDSNTNFLNIGAEEPPLNDRRVRMALNYAVDRNVLRGSVFSKDVVPASQIIAPSIFGHNPRIPLWPYDPQKARQLLEEARKDGVPVDKEIQLVERIGQYPGSAELAEALQAMYAAVGLNVKIKALEMGASRPYTDKPYAKSGPFIASVTHDNSFGDAVFTLFVFYHCTAAKGHICSKSMDDLLERAQAASGETRKNLWWEAAKRVYDEVQQVMLFYMVSYARVGKRINFKPDLVSNREIQLAKITFK